MQAPSASELLAVWERARAEPITTQALILLEAASPGESRRDLAKLSIGQRDARLLELRELLFGSRLTGLTSCPRCKQQLEIGIEAADIRANSDRSASELLTAEWGAYVARFRLPNTDDLTAVAAAAGGLPEAPSAIESLLSRCLVELRRGGRDQKMKQRRALPPHLVQAIADEMEAADPQANVQLPLDCLDCGHRWVSVFDIVSFLWKELDHFANTLLREVCVLARAFGWREHDILAMSPQRRRLYLQMINDGG